VPTAFTLKITDAKGASLVDRTTSVIATNPLYINGVLAHQYTKGTKAIALFRNVNVGDLLYGDNEFVKITLSNAKNGTLENLSGGSYNKETGVYLIHGSGLQVTTAVRGLKFDPATSSGSAVTTVFTISSRNADGASVTNSKTTVIDNPAAPATAATTAVALFSQYVASGLHAMPDHAAGIPALHDPQHSSHFEFAGSHR